MADNIRVEGWAELNRAMRRCQKATRKAFRDEAKAVGNIIRDEIKTRAPKASGNLERSVKTRINMRGISVAATAKRSSPAYPDGYQYGRRLEFDPAYSGRYAFFYPGYEAKKAEAKARFEKVLETAVKAFKG